MQLASQSGDNLILIRTKSVCAQRAVPCNATWTAVVYTARPVLATLQTSHRRLRDSTRATIALRASVARVSESRLNPKIPETYCNSTIN